jgi:hypothetical protein
MERSYRLGKRQTVSSCYRIHKEEELSEGLRSL